MPQPLNWQPIPKQSRMEQENAQGLGLIQATISNVIWQKYELLGITKQVLNALETEIGAAGGAQTYLQLVSMVKLQFTDSMDLLPQIQQFQDNYNLIMLNGHSKLTEDLATFLFCLSLPDSYESTARQYLHNIMIINFQMSLHESFEKRIGEKLMLSDRAHPSTSSQPRRTSGKSVPNVVRQTTQHRTTGPGGRTQIKKAKDNQSPKSLIRLEKRRQTKKGKTRKRHQQVPMYYLYRKWPICLYKWPNQSIFHVTRQVRKWNSAWIVDAQIISHQARAISSNIGN